MMYRKETWEKIENAIQGYLPVPKTPKYLGKNMFQDENEIYYYYGQGSGEGRITRYPNILVLENGSVYQSEKDELPRKIK